MEMENGEPKFAINPSGFSGFQTAGAQRVDKRTLRREPLRAGRPSSLINPATKLPHSIPREVENRPESPEEARVRIESLRVKMLIASALLAVAGFLMTISDVQQSFHSHQPTSYLDGVGRASFWGSWVMPRNQYPLWIPGSAEHFGWLLLVTAICTGVYVKTRWRRSSDASAE
jgi:hypothetical protein